MSVLIHVVYVVQIPEYVDNIYQKMSLSIQGPQQQT